MAVSNYKGVPKKDALDYMRVIFYEAGDDPFTPEVDTINFSNGGASDADSLPVAYSVAMTTLRNSSPNTTYLI